MTAKIILESSKIMCVLGCSEALRNADIVFYHMHLVCEEGRE